MKLNWGFSEHEQRGTKKRFSSNKFRVCQKGIRQTDRSFDGLQMAYSASLYGVERAAQNR